MQNSEYQSLPVGVDGTYLGAQTKKCTKCGETKPLEGFCKRGKAKDGRYNSCRSCESAVSKAYYEKNRDRIVANVRAYSEENREKVLQGKRDYYQNNSDRLKAASAAYQREHKEQSNAHKAAWVARNPEKRIESSRAWYARNAGSVSLKHKEKYRRFRNRILEGTKRWQRANKSHVTSVARLWRWANPDKASATIARRRTRTRAVPFRDDEAILAVYSLAKDLTTATGVKHVVDHVYPIAGKTVSGLHTAANLAAVTKQDNLFKSNKLPGHLAHELWDPEGSDVYYPEVAHG